MKDIAAKCGVTVATVSKALSDKDDIGEEMKIKIRKTATIFFHTFYPYVIRFCIYGVGINKFCLFESAISISKTDM